MARGWESKSVEEQQSQAAEARVSGKARLTAAEQARQREKDSLVLSRKRVMQQMEKAQNAGHRRMLEQALADLDARLAAFL
jgi:hypothetical protein